jgi:hypothetical protein
MNLPKRNGLTAARIIAMRKSLGKSLGKSPGLILLAALPFVSWPSVQAQQSTGPGAGAETPQADLAAQVRIQGFACDKALGATRDAKRSKPDHPVYVLKCSNATYRVSRVPDMAAKIERLP